MANPTHTHPHPENQTTLPDEPTALQPRMREVWVEHGGVRLFAVDSGFGRPFVFIHGGLADHRAALFHVGELAASRRLLAPDLRGSGRSVYAGSLSWDLLADDIAALLDHLALDHAVVGGTSMGSGVALRFALRHPARLAGLMLASPLYPGADRPLVEASREAMRILGAAGERALTVGIGALRPLYERLPPAVRDVALRMLLDFDAASVAATTRFLASGVQPMASARDLAAIGTKVVVVAGTDPEHPAEIAELYARHLRQAVLVAPPVAEDRPRLVELCELL